MGQITALSAQQVGRTLDKRAWLEPLGMALDCPLDRSHMFEAADCCAFLENVARADPHATDLPLRKGASTRCDDYGAFGLAWKSALNLRGSSERAGHYASVLTSDSTHEVRDLEEG